MSGLPSLIPPSVMQPSNDVWFDDGNVILQAESTLFKVYRGILVQNSTVFHDMVGELRTGSVSNKVYHGYSSQFHRPPVALKHINHVP